MTVKVHEEEEEKEIVRKYELDIERTLKKERKKKERWKEADRGKETMLDVKGSVTRIFHLDFFSRASELC